MAPNLIELVNEYYKARKPYSQILQEAHTTPSSQNSTLEATAESSDTASSQQAPQFSLSPKLPKEELSDVLKKLEAAKIEYAHQGEKASSSSSSSSSEGKKGKAPAGKE